MIGFFLVPTKSAKNIYAQSANSVNTANTAYSYGYQEEPTRPLGTLRRQDGQELSPPPGVGVGTPKKRSAIVPLDTKRKTDVVRRIKTARAHLEGVLGMIEDDAYCIAMLMQLSAISSALNQVSHIIVQQHLDRCFMELIRSGDEKTAIVDLLNTLEYDQRSMITR